MLRVLDNLQLSAAKTGDRGILIYFTSIPAAVKDRLDTVGLVRQGRFLSHFAGFKKIFMYIGYAAQVADRLSDILGLLASARPHPERKRGTRPPPRGGCVSKPHCERPLNPRPSRRHRVLTLARCVLCVRRYAPSCRQVQTRSAGEASVCGASSGVKQRPDRHNER